jgi:hypothetical protein
MGQTEFPVRPIEYKTKAGIPICYNSMDLKGKERFPHESLNESNGTLRIIQ